MRILVLSHEYPPVGGGGGRVAQDLCEGLAQRGHAVQVLTAHYNGLDLEEVRQNVRIRRLVSGRHAPYVASFGAMLQYVLAAYRVGLPLIRSWKPDVLHVHFAVPGGVIGRALSRATGIPYVITAHLGDVPGGTPEKTERWFRWVYPFTPAIWRDAARVVAVSAYTRQLAMRHYPVPIEVIPNGVDLQALCPGAHPGEPPRLIFAGRFAEQKNPLQVVRVLSGLRELPWHCVMAGDGALRPAVEAELQATGLAERFTLTGWIEPQQVVDWFERSDILFMPSRSEGLPVVGVQALAMGLALVVGRAGGFVELVEEGQNGFVCDPENTQAMQNALSVLLGDSAQLIAFRQRSRELAGRFDLQNVLDAYEQVLAQAMQRKRR
ncbi:MAG: glycosyltransferase family 4 protein [Anaerolinea sp.]|nr:glycosyltransferase family 4 protein [Anaerolinea sp.]